MHSRDKWDGKRQCIKDPKYKIQKVPKRKADITNM